MSSNISSTTVQGWRQRPPSSYSTKINNFSQLESSSLYSNGKYQSRLFSTGDYKWRLIIYPKGNDKDNGSGFISMYVEIDSTSLISTSQAEVCADLRFFIFNKKENKYFTIQDVESKTFNTLRPIWGLPQVLQVTTFNDPKNGYLFDGEHCEFGVDVFVVPPPNKLEILSFDAKVSYPKFCWTVKKFSEIKENPHTSKSFTIGGKKWALKLYPKGFSTEDSKWVSIYLDSVDGEAKEDDRIYVKADIKVENPLGSNHLKLEFNWWFNATSFSAGWDHYVTMDDLRKSYLDKEDNLKIEIEFKIVSSIKFS